MAKKILTLIVLVSLFVFGAIFAMALRQPDQYNVSRKIHIKAPAEAIFPHINDLRNWSQWSPWAQLDPEMQVKVEGLPGQGSTMTWKGKKFGEGSMTIIDSREPEWIKIQLDSKSPFESTAESAFNLESEDQGTNVYWTIGGAHNFTAKLMNVFFDTEAIIGKDFERGLNSLKEVVEKDKKGNRP